MVGMMDGWLDGWIEYMGRMDVRLSGLHIVTDAVQPQQCRLTGKYTLFA